MSRDIAEELSVSQTTDPWGLRRLLESLAQDDCAHSWRNFDPGGTLEGLLEWGKARRSPRLEELRPRRDAGGAAGVGERAPAHPAVLLPPPPRRRAAAGGGRRGGGPGAPGLHARRVPGARPLLHPPGVPEPGLLPPGAEVPAGALPRALRGFAERRPHRRDERADLAGDHRPRPA